MDLIITTQDDLRGLISDTIKELLPTAPAPTSEPKYLSKKSAAELLDVSISTIDNFRRKGFLRYHRILGTVRFLQHELLEDMAGMTKTA